MSFLTVDEISALIAKVPDFPKKGILFQDITPLLAHPNGIPSVVEHFYQMIKEKDIKVDVIAGIESRGFLFGVPLAEKLDVGFVPIRKPGKLPRAIYFEEYSLEYGSDRLEIHQDAVSSGDHVVIIDDLLATGGTALASAKLIEKTGANLRAIAFLIELAGLPGGEKLTGYVNESLLKC
jgi:adenine phosphoribosyltransferase